MNAIPSAPERNPEFHQSPASEASGRPTDASTGAVWLLEPSRIGHLPACLRALGVALGQDGRGD